MISAERFKKIRAVISDIDGVLTDGRAGYGAPDLIKFFNFKDGLWMRMAMRAGLIVGMFSGKESNANKTRAAELGLSFCYEGMTDKLAGFERLLKEYDLKPEECLFAGDDLIDLPPIRRCGFAVAPANAHTLVKEEADLCTVAKGGEGAVAEAIEYLLKGQGKWDSCIERYYS